VNIVVTCWEIPRVRKERGERRKICRQDLEKVEEQQRLGIDNEQRTKRETDNSKKEAWGALPPRPPSVYEKGEKES
jgi:hypothetical protein